jgi:ArsR family transcriptional regulator
MDKTTAVNSFAALAQETRLSAVRLLVEHGRTGLPAGDLAQQLGVPHNTLSFHLAHLERAGLVTSQRNGRQVFYYAGIEAIQTLAQFLLANCCVRENKRTAGCSSKSKRNCP